jgi:hypothetical protein
MTSGAVYGFVPAATRYVEAFKLHPPLDWADAWAFGGSIEMFGARFAIAADEAIWAGEGTTAGLVYTYSRAGAGAVPLGAMAVSQGRLASIDIVNRWLIVGTPFAGFCLFEWDCAGEAEVYDLSSFGP